MCVQSVYVFVMNLPAIIQKLVLPVRKMACLSFEWKKTEDVALTLLMLLLLLLLVKNRVRKMMTGASASLQTERNRQDK